MPADEIEVARAQGAVEARVTNLEEDLHELKKDVKYIRDVLAELSGGKKVAWVLMIAVGSVLTVAVEFMFKKIGG